MGFTHVVGKFSNEVATIKAAFVGSDSFLHVEALQRVGAEVLDDVPKSRAVLEELAEEGLPDSSWSRCPSQFPPQGKGTEIRRG